MRTVNLITWLLVIIPGCVCIKHVDVKFLLFDNKGEEDWNGLDCDMFEDSQCEPKFTVCLDLVSSGNQDPDQCHNGLISIKSEVHSDADPQDYSSLTSIAGMANPIRGTTSKNGQIALKVLVEDEDSNPLEGGDDVMDKMYQALDQTPAYNGTINVWKRVTMIGKRTRANNPSELTIHYRIYCASNYYGVECDLFCQPTDDVTKGHYYCDSTGNKICLDGWESPELDCTVWQDDCTSNLCANGATCVDGYKNYTCDCVHGFIGYLCEATLRDCSTSPCVHGTCRDTSGGHYVCDCDEGYHGPTCAYVICMQSSSTEPGSALKDNNSNCQSWVYPMVAVLSTLLVMTSFATGVLTYKLLKLHKGTCRPKVQRSLSAGKSGRISPMTSSPPSATSYNTMPPPYVE